MPVENPALLLRRHIPGSVKKVLRGILHYAGVYSGRIDPLLPPPWLHSVGDSDFHKTGKEFLGHFIELGGLKHTERVLDIGCGTGRMAIHLADYLDGGTYDGIDIVGPSIAWCQRAYRGHPGFRFHHSDIYNKFYNKGGTVKASDYRFPFADASFDFIFLTSVFTHMLAEDVDHYLAEIRRVLAPGGRVLVTAFLLNHETLRLIEAGKSTFTFREPLEGCFVEVADVPECAVAYDEAAFGSMIERHGLTIAQTHLGQWRGVPGLSFQDIVIAA